MREKLILNNKAKDTLFKIFTTSNKDSINDVLNCYVPHHSVIFYKKGKCSYIDICLDYQKYNFSKDIKTDKNDLSYRTWKDLEAFFRVKNFIYEMPDKKD